METLRFNALLERIAKKDEPAFIELYEEYGKKIKWVAFITLGSRDIVEDILNEVCIRIWNSPHGYVTNPNAYIYQITKNTALNFYKKNLKGSKNNVSLESVAESAAVPDAFAFVEFTALLLGLNETEREIVIRKVMYSYTYPEIAAELKISVGLAHKRYQNALIKLKNESFLKS